MKQLAGFGAPSSLLHSENLSKDSRGAPWTQDSRKERVPLELQCLFHWQQYKACDGMGLDHTSQIIVPESWESLNGEAVKSWLPSKPLAQMCKSLPVQIQLESLPEGNFIASPPAQFMTQHQKGKFLITYPGLSDTNEWLQPRSWNLLSLTESPRFKLLLRCFKHRQFAKENMSHCKRWEKNVNFKLQPTQHHTHTHIHTQVCTKYQILFLSFP